MEGFEEKDGSWVFPKLAATACSDLTDSDIAVIDGFAPMGVSLNCGKFGEFVSPWLRISADGEWIEYQIGVYGSGR